MQYNFKQSSIAFYEGQFKNWIPEEIANMFLDDFTRPFVQDLIFNHPRAERVARITQRNLLKYTRRLFCLALEEGILSRNPCAGIIIPSEERQLDVLTSKEVNSLLKNAKEVGHEFYPVWMMAVLTGMRSGELYALRWQDIDFESRLISVNKQWTSKDGIALTKTRSNRVVPSSDLLTFLKEEKLKGENKETLFDTRSKSKVELIRNSRH